MRKQDLKDGMILEMRDGKRYLLVNGILRDPDDFIRLSSYNNDLTYLTHRRHTFDIIKVYGDTTAYSLRSIFEDEYLSLLWERKEIKLNDREIEILKALKTLCYTYIARDKNSNLYAYKERPSKHMLSWWIDDSWIISIPNEKDLFNFIKWEDEEATNIDDLLNKMQLIY